MPVQGPGLSQWFSQHVTIKADQQNLIKADQQTLSTNM
jgi:hypothetical protein